MSEPRRYVVLDTYRYIAAAGVVMYHNEANFAPFLPGYVERLERLTHLVDFFFVLSGFVLMHTYGSSVRTWGDFGRFMQKRLARVYPLHFVTTMIFIVAAAAIALTGFQLRDPGATDPALFAPTLLLLQAWGTTSHPGLNFPSWSISAELFVYLLFPLFAMLLVRVRPLGALLVAVAIALAMDFVRTSLGLRSWTMATHDYGMLRAVPTFLSGMAVSVIVRNLPARPVSWRGPHLFMAAIFLLMISGVRAEFIIAAFPVAVGYIALAERGGDPSRLASPLCARLGDASYGVYLLHMFVQIAAVQVVKKFGLTTPAELVGMSIAVLIVTTVLAMLSFVLFENPARRFFGRTFFGKTAAPERAT